MTTYVKLLVRYADFMKMKLALIILNSGQAAFQDSFEKQCIAD